MIQLPNGDLWTAPQYDDEGNLKERTDTVTTAGLPTRPLGGMTPDQAAMLMAQMQEIANQPKK